MDVTAVPAVTLGLSADVLIVPSVCTKYVWPGVKLDCVVLTPPLISTVAVSVSAAAYSAMPIKFSEVKLVGVLAFWKITPVP